MNTQNIHPFLKKLLNGATVEWKPLGEVAEIKRGKRVTKRELSPDKKYPVYSGGVIPMGYFDKYNQCENTITVVKYGTAGFVNFITEKFWANDVCYCIKPDKKLNNKYLLYILKNKQNYINSLVTNAIPAHLPTEEISELQIPIPPLAVQSELVKILDKFTELTAELTARKKQYAYYRDKLLTFADEAVEWKPLGEVLVRTKGTKITATQMKELNKIGAPLKIFAGGKTVAFVNYEDIPKNDINRKPSIIVKSRGIIEFEYYEQPFSHKNEMWSYHSSNDNINIKFIYYFLKMNEFYFQSIGSKMQMPQIAIPDTDKFQIPIPPLAEQERIVKILDKFDTLTNSISEGIPREIELRKKQYEYYRDKLLTFPKATTDAHG